ncbi:MAG: hypothetical protein HYX84_01090 [Chloroflexi bacterium]|nr:hypothetical protein [Chloroflexota bacterium]
MKPGILLNTNAPEPSWNALRLGNQALSRGNEVKIFPLGSGVEVPGRFDRAFSCIWIPG